MDVAETAPAAKPGDVVLAVLRRPLADLPGVGPGLLRLLRRLLGVAEPTVLDLMALRPSGAIDPAPCPRLVPELLGRPVTLQCRIGRHRPAARRGAPWRIAAEAAGEPLDLVLFNVRGEWPLRRYPVGAVMRLHGRLARFADRWQLAHPEPLPGEQALALYPLTEGLSQGRLRRLVAAALAGLPEPPEWLDRTHLRRQRWPAWRDALVSLHAAEGAALPARRRLAYDELLALQLALALMRRGRETGGGRRIAAAGELRERLVATLPYAPTPAQAAAVAEILADMAAPSPMLRLLMGDVGSGKTLVALLAMLEAIEAGGQTVLLAPTEALAQQHAARLAALLPPLGLRPELLTGRQPGRARAAALARVATGAAALVVATHAVLEAGVAFADLMLAVIDEQHRFGVHQRLALRAKGAAVDMLLLTATPIPRTLLLSAYGDIATSRLAEKPAGRLPVRTAALPIGRLDEVLGGLARALGRGERAFWICPLIGEALALDAAAAEARAAMLRQRFGAAVGLVHGRLKSAEKAAALEAFARGATPLLVATTVIEVGIDVPEASVIVVEGAERFGLAQLHQLRGRVGRGARPSHCLLLYTPPLGAAARARLEVLRATEDGLAIAEADLRLRGPGEVLGPRQSGLPRFRFADLAQDRDLLEQAHDDARLALARDPSLRLPRGRALRLLLELFERDAATGLVAAG